MKEYIEERAIQIANYIIDENATVRQTAKRFGISKSTVHKDVTDRLIHIDPSLAAQARVVLDLRMERRSSVLRRQPESRRMRRRSKQKAQDSVTARHAQRLLRS